MFTDVELRLRRAADQSDPTAASAAYTIEIVVTRADSGSKEHPLAGQRPLLRLNPDAIPEATLDPEAYGRWLTATLFADQRVRSALAAARGYAAGRAPLRLRLDLDDADSLICSLRWETLRDPEDTDIAFALSRDVLLSRYLASREPLKVDTPRREGLRALLIVAAPPGLEAYGLSAIDATAEVARARSALGDLPTTVICSQSEGRPASLTNIREALREEPQLVVIVAHGAAADGRTVLWLEDDTGAIARVDGEQFEQLVKQLSTRPLLAVLLACQSAASSRDDGALATLGPALVGAGVGAVLAMQENVSQATVGKLLPSLLGELLRHGRIDVAVAEARKLVQDRPDWWVPVLYLRVGDGRLWRIGEVLGKIVERSLRPPPAPRLFGRKEDLERYQAALEAEHLAVICGAPGAGKSALAAALAHQAAGAGLPFWFSFEEGGLRELARRLAAHLALDGVLGLDDLLAEAPEAGAAPGRAWEDIARLRERLRGKEQLLCLDNLPPTARNAAEADEQEDVLVLLREAARAGDIALIVTAWGVPAALTAVADPRPLAGLDLGAVSELFAARGIVLNEAQARRLWEQTAGLPRDLELIANLMERGAELEPLLGSVRASGDVDGGVLGAAHKRHVLSIISTPQQRVLEALAVLQGSGSRRALEAVLAEQESFQDELQQLEAWNIIGLESGERPTYSFAGLLRHYCYHLPSGDQCRSMHRNASAFYADIAERDELRAIEQAIRAEAFTQAVQLSEENFRPVLRKKQATALRELLRGIDRERLAPLGRAGAALVEASLARSQGEGEEALRLIDRAIFLAEHQPGPDSVLLLARAYAARSRVLNANNPEEALLAAEEGLEVVAAGQSPERRCALLIAKGAALLALQRNREAEEAYQEALGLAQRGLSPIWVDVLVGLAAAQEALCEFKAALRSLERAERVAEEIQDSHRLAMIAADRGNNRKALGNWPGALEDYDTALALAVRIESRFQQGRAYYNRGAVLLKQGELDAAEFAFTQALALANREICRNSHCGLAEIALLSRRPDAAEEQLDAAQALADEMELPDDPEITRLRAELALLGAQPAEALRLARLAVSFVPEQDSYQRGICLGSEAAALLAAGQSAAARATLETSIAIFTPHYPYEQAVAQAALARVLRAEGEPAAAASTAAAARSTFERLGARRDLEALLS